MKIFYHIDEDIAFIGCKLFCLNFSATICGCHCTVSSRINLFLKTKLGNCYGYLHFPSSLCNLFRLWASLTKNSEGSYVNSIGTSISGLEMTKNKELSMELSIWRSDRICGFHRRFWLRSWFTGVLGFLYSALCMFQECGPQYCFTYGTTLWGTWHEIQSSIISHLY